MRALGIIPLFLSLFVFTSAQGYAEGLSHPKGPVILTVTGKIAHTNGEGSAQFDRDMLMNLGMVSFTTGTPWHDRRIKFEGPSGRSLMKALGVTKGTMKVRALNDYVADVPVQDFFVTGAILAMKADGKPMRVREKGPLFIVYPYDSDPDLQNDSYYTRSVWQIKSIHIE